MTVTLQVSAWTPADGTQNGRAHDVSWRWYDTDGATSLGGQSAVVGGGGVGSSYETRWTSSQRVSLRAGQTISVWHSRRDVQGFVGVELRIDEVAPPPPGTWDLAAEFVSTGGASSGIGREGAWSYGDDTTGGNDLSGYVQHPRHRGVWPGRYTDDTQMSLAVAEALSVKVSTSYPALWNIGLRRLQTIGSSSRMRICNLSPEFLVALEESIFKPPSGFQCGG